MPNQIRPDVARELKNSIQIIDADPYGWWAVHTALVCAARLLAEGDVGYLEVAKMSLAHATNSGFGTGRSETSATRFTGKSVMAWQDALFVVNELPEWRFPDEVLLVAWLVECGGPEMGRGPATASFHKNTAGHYIRGTRKRYNDGAHGNGPGWPTSNRWEARSCRYLRN